MADAEPTSTGRAPDREHALGLLFGLGAYSFWGFLPIYFKLVAAAPPVEMLAHRVVWALILLIALSWHQGLLGELRQALRPGRTLALLAATTVLIAINWLVYIWAVVNGRILEGSLGYFINPFVNVLLGVIVLKERLERPVVVAVLVATLLVAVFLYGEPFTASRGVAFACIWAALAIFAVHTLRRGRPEPITEA